MTPTRRLLLLCTLAPFASGPALAGPLPKDKLPDPLKSWTAWAMHGHEALSCPTLLGLDQGDDDQAAPGCLWMSRLELQLDAKGGRFTQAARTFTPGFVPLPGDARRWPLDVKVDGRPGAVLEHEGAPALLVEPGDHAVTGTFSWTGLPESLPVPPVTGLVSLSLHGRAVPFPVREEDGNLWLQRDEEADAGQNRLDVTVHRRVIDEVPLLVVTRVRLDVSGKNREVVLGRALLDGFSPLALGSPLPARMEPDGRLRVQVRPGTFTLELTARKDGAITSLPLAPQAPGALWPAEEIWVFDARPALRVVELSGLPQLDAAQTTLAADWRLLPAWRIRPGEALALTVQRRGDQDPAPDKLALSRLLWLDFDGRGYTARDQLTGSLTRSWRLEMPAPSTLGRVTLDGQDQLITRTAGGAPGVELRAGALSLTAESRVDEGTRTLPAVGWGHDVNALSATLVLPPGWRLLHAGGVDDVSQTWLSRWSLLDLFLVLMVALAVARLFGIGWGVLAFAAVSLSIPEGAPRWAWLFPLAAEGLVRVVPPGRFSRALTLLRGATWLALAFALLPFAVQHLRGGLFPALEARVDEEASSLDASRLFAMQARNAESLAAAAPQAMAEQSIAGREGGVPGGFVGGVIGDQGGGAAGLGSKGTGAGGGGIGKKLKKPAQRALLSKADNDGDESLLLGFGASSASASRPAYRQQAQQLDPNAIVQTGAGLPSWSWRSVFLKWSGPVDKSAQLSLWLIPPWANLALAFLRVLLLASLFGLLLVRRTRGPGGFFASPSPDANATPAAVALALLALTAPGLARAGELPTDEQLAELRAKLTQRPDCAPRCADSPKLVVDASPGALKLTVTVAAAAPVAVPLPGGLAQWSPDKVLLDGAPAKALQRKDGALYVLVEAGVHTLELGGPLPASDSVQLPLPLRPRRVESRLSGWTLDGVHEDGTAEESLQLSRIQKGERNKLEPGQLPPYASVTRTLQLGLLWKVETRVERRSPASAPVVLEIPLLAGEAITSVDVRAEKGRALVTLSARTPAVTWTSVLSEQPALELVAPAGVPWSETWILDVSPVWHADVTGLAPVLQPPGGARVREFRPVPGEKLSLALARPAAVPGQSLTVQSSHLEVSPGARQSDVSLELKLTTSRGGPFTLTLPDDAVLQAMSVDGAVQPQRQEGRKVVLTLPPGDHAAKVDWREPVGLSPVFHTPRVDLGQASVNSTVNLKLPDRWVLLLGGPRLGPAVLFWSFLLVLLVVGASLARLPLAPLRAHQWILLAIGLSQTDLLGAALVAGWLLVLGVRRAHGERVKSARLFDLAQLVLVAWTILAFAVLFGSIHRGLLGSPDMQVSGNGSWAQDLRWFTDRSPARLPTAWAISVPLLVYRVAMLAWALWLASSLVRWLPWAWTGFSAGGFWRPFRRARPAVAAATLAATQPVVEAQAAPERSP